MSAVTLRFCDADMEVAYKAKTEQRILRPMLVASGFIVLFFLVFLPEEYHTEREREDVPFRWGTDDPRSIYFGAHLGIWLVALVTATLATLRICCGRLLAIDWELIATSFLAAFVSSLFLLSSWHTASLVGVPVEAVYKGETRDGEFVTLSEITIVVAGACIYCPIRVCFVWIVPLCAVSSYVAMVSVVGSPFPQSSMRCGIYLAFLCFISYQGARRNERNDREMWYHVGRLTHEGGELKKTKNAYEQVASAFCEIVVRLSADGTIEDSDRMHESFFGRNMVGEHFSSVLQPGDRERFAALREEASKSQTLQSMPATLELRYATAQVQLVVVDANAANSKEPSWLVGVHSAEPCHHGEAVEIDANVMSSIARDAPSDVDQETHMESLPTTTETGRMFADFYHHDHTDQGDGEVKEPLEQLAQMGLREHWLISQSDMELLPDKPLGSGGFGIVLTGRLRGTLVAVKLPKWSVGGRPPPSVASLSNELRLQRHIRHPNIVLWHGACIHPPSGHIALVYELINGTKLDVFVDERLANRPEVHARHKLLLDIVCALRFLHTHRPTIVHGDLKTSNILVERWASGPRAKLLDFGLAQLMTKYAEPLGGTLEWMAPELLVEQRGRTRVAPSADIFSLGRLVYYVCTGQRPLAGFQTSLILHMARQKRPVPLRWIDSDCSSFQQECRDVCDQCLSLNPKARPDIVAVQSRLTSSMVQGSLQEHGSNDASYRALYLKGSAFASGLRELEATTGSDFSSDFVTDTARDRGRALLDQLEAMMECQGTRRVQNAGLDDPDPGDRNVSL